MLLLCYIDSPCLSEKVDWSESFVFQVKEAVDEYFPDLIMETTLTSSIKYYNHQLLPFLEDLTAKICIPVHTQPFMLYEPAECVRTANDHYLTFALLIFLVVIWTPFPKDQYEVSLQLQENAEEPFYHHTTIVPQFKAQRLDKVHPDLKNPHALSASYRCTANRFMNWFCASVGAARYDTQTSASVDKAGAPGSRVWYWAKDVNVDPKMDWSSDNNVRTLVDVDYYVDMNLFLTEQFKPVLIYTFIPENAAGQESDYSYTFMKNGAVKVTMHGGGLYEHQLWNYSSDTVTAHYQHWFWQPEPIVCVYKCEKRKVAPNRFIILLSPIRKWTGSAANLFTEFIKYEPLERHQLVKDDWAVVVTLNNPVTWSLARTGEYLCATLPQMCITALRSAAATSALKLNPQSIMKYLKDTHDLYMKNAEAMLIRDYLINHEKIPWIMNVVPISEAIIPYCYGPPPIQMLKPKLVPFMSPLINAAWTPIESVENHNMAVKYRVTSIANTKVTKADKFLTRCIYEFVQCVAPQEKIFPVEFEEVHDKQSRPTQRRKFEEAQMNVGSTGTVSTFIKAEAYSKPSPPRIISTIGSFNKIEYSRYMYALSDHCKQFPWYAFGMPPIKVASRVAEVCLGAEFVTETDFSKWDGRVGSIIRDLERILLVNTFDKSCCNEICQLHETQMHQHATTSLGVGYDTNYSRLSGSPETSVLNSVDNAFIAFYALRLQGYEPLEAMDRLGIYGGDDGLTAGVEEKYYNQASKAVGQKLTYKLIPNGEEVKFLARGYDDPWNGSNNSYCDVARQLAKFHVTPNVQATPLEKLSEKVRSFMVTDPNTPVLGDFLKVASTYLPACRLNETTALQLRRWQTEDIPDNRYPNEPTEQAEANVCAGLDRYLFDYETFRRAINHVECAEDLLELPVCAITPPQPNPYPEELSAPQGLVEEKQPEPPKPQKTNDKQAARKDKKKTNSAQRAKKYRQKK
jgi:hypothetical protein